MFLDVPMFYQSVPIYFPWFSYHPQQIQVWSPSSADFRATKSETNSGAAPAKASWGRDSDVEVPVKHPKKNSLW